MRLDLSKVQIVCAIQGCRQVLERGDLLDRHHIRSQKLFVHAFRDRDSKRYRAFKARYERFDEDDIIRICRAHHEQVHDLIYKPLIAQHIARVGRPLWQWSWKEARILMNDFERYFWEWKKHEEHLLARAYSVRTE